MLQQDQDRMQRFQERTSKVIVKDPTIHSSEALNKLNWLPLSSRRDYHKIKLVYKCINSMAPEYLSESFQNRNNDFIRLPSFRHNFGKRTFRVWGAKYFNNLPKNTRTAQSLASFLNLSKIILTH